MRAVLVTSLLAITVVAAGCSGAPGATAKDLLGTAQNEARSWSPNAKLVGIVGLEGGINIPEMDEAFPDFGQPGAWLRESLDRARKDPEMGDGRCEAWAYAFYDSGKRQGYLVLVNASGGPPRKVSFPASSQMPLLTEWRLDSTDALALAARANAGLREVLDAGGGLGVLYVLSQPQPTVPAWGVLSAGLSAEGPKGGMTILDARNGKILHNIEDFTDGSAWDEWH